MVASAAISDILYGNIAEILSDRLFFGSLKSLPKPDPSIRYIRLEDRVSFSFYVHHNFRYIMNRFIRTLGHSTYQFFIDFAKQFMFC